MASSITKLPGITAELLRIPEFVPIFQNPKLAKRRATPTGIPECDVTLRQWRKRNSAGILLNSNRNGITLFLPEVWDKNENGTGNIGGRGKTILHHSRHCPLHLPRCPILLLPSSLPLHPTASPPSTASSPEATAAYQNHKESLRQPSTFINKTCGCRNKSSKPLPSKQPFCCRCLCHQKWAFVFGTHEEND